MYPFPLFVWVSCIPSVLKITSAYCIVIYSEGLELVIEPHSLPRDRANQVVSDCGSFSVLSLIMGLEGWEMRLDPLAGAHVVVL